MTFEQLMYRMSDDGLTLMNCTYSSHGGGCRCIEDEKGNVEFIAQNAMVIRSKAKRKKYTWNYRTNLFVFSDPFSGTIFHTDFDDLLPQDREIKLEELLSIINYKKSELLEMFGIENEADLDFSEVEESINNHQIDLELRRMILQLVALKLLYSDNTIPERGYQRATRFIGEFNKYIPDLQLDMTQIQEIMQQNYTNKKNIMEEINSSCEQESDALEEKGIKRFIKKYFFNKDNIIK